MERVKKDIEFVYDMFGQTLVWRVLKQYGRGWLCEVAEGPHQCIRAEFNAKTIRIGIYRRNLQLVKSSNLFPGEGGVAVL